MHITQKPVGTRYTMLIPDDGYQLTDGNGVYDKATVLNKDIPKWHAIEIDREEM